jgi:hypothetical protein
MKIVKLLIISLFSLNLNTFGNEIKIIPSMSSQAIEQDKSIIINVIYLNKIIKYPYLGNSQDIQKNILNILKITSKKNYTIRNDGATINVFIYDKSEITIFDDTKIKISDNIYINGKGIDNHSEAIILGNKIFLK